MYTFIFCAFLIIAVSAAPVDNPDFVLRSDRHNLINCETDAHDQWKILHRETITVRGQGSKILQQAITFPETGVAREFLTCIRATDLIGDGTGGFPDIQMGGLGFPYVTINFTSQPGYGFKFLVEIYGKNK